VPPKDNQDNRTKCLHHPITAESPGTCQQFLPEDSATFDTVFLPAFHANLNFFFVKIECGLYFLDRFDVLISKMIFKK